MCGGPSSSLWCVKCDFDDDVNVDSGDVNGLFRMLMIEEVLMMMVLKIENLRREKRAADKASPRIPSPTLSPL